MPKSAVALACSEHQHEGERGLVEAVIILVSNIPLLVTCYYHHYDYHYW